MAVIPDANSLGRRSIPQSGRGMVSVDLSAGAEGMIRAGRQVSQFGEVVNKQIEEQNLADNKIQSANAILEAQKLQSSYNEWMQTNPSKYSDFEQNYNKLWDESTPKILSGIKDPITRQMTYNALEEMRLKGRSATLAQANENNSQYTIANINTGFETSLNSIQTWDDVSSATLVNNALIDGNVAKGVIKPEKGFELKSQHTKALQSRWSDTISRNVGKYIETGDIQSANNYYNTNKATLPISERDKIEKILYSSNTKYNGDKNAEDLLSGRPLSSPIGYVPQVQKTLVNTAQSYGVDPNSALTVASIESNFGQNVGKRGDIGQTGKGGDLNAQAKNLVSEFRKSENFAEKALGRKPAAWESYIVYQQGAGGGPALLKSAVDNPYARAVDVLKPLYKTENLAIEAIVGNGGNESMTSGQFLDYIKNRYKTHESRVMSDFPKMDILFGQNIPTVPAGQIEAGNIDLSNRPIVINQDGSISTVRSISVNFDGMEVLIPTVSDDGRAMSDDEAVTEYKDSGRHLGKFDTKENASAYAEQVHQQQATQYVPMGDKIVSSREQVGLAVQQGDTPVQSLLKFDEVYPDAIKRAQAIPNIDERKATIEAIEKRRLLAQSAANAWKTKFKNDAQNLAIDPNFTSVDQIPPDMRSALSDDPTTMTYLQQRAAYNLENSASGGFARDIKNNGPNFYEVYSKILDGKITSAEEINAAFVNKEITLAGHDKAMAALKNQDDAIDPLKKQLFVTAKSAISDPAKMFGVPDPKGEEQYSKFLNAAIAKEQQWKKEGKDIAPLYNPESLDYLGKMIPAFKRSPTEIFDEVGKQMGTLSSSTAPAKVYNAAEIDAGLTAGTIERSEGEKAIKELYRSDKTKAMELAIKFNYIKTPPRPE